MSEALAGCGPDEVHQAHCRGVAMVYRALHVSAESRRLRQPLLTRDGVLMTWDGRLDNHADLQRRLELDADPGQPDVEIIIQAYRRWGEDFVSLLIGDFALALWDSKARRLCLARDSFAGRPLFFVARRDKIFWASTMRALFATGEVMPEVDDAWVGAFIVSAEPADRSPFTSIEVVAPGEAFIVTPWSRRRRQFWTPDGDRSIRYKRDEDYEDAFRELFIDAVRCRLRASGTVFAELSGGLDSSSIVCVADRLIKEGEVEATALCTQSWVYDRAADSDEREFINLVEAHTGCRAFHILEDEYPALTGFEQLRPQVPNGYQIWPTGRRRAIELLHENQARVLLSGFAGDHLMWSQMEAPSHLADYVVQLKLGQLLRELGRWHREAAHPYPSLWWDGVLKPLWRTIRGNGSEGLKFSFAWLSEELRLRMADYAARSLDWGVGFVLPSRRMRLDAIRWVVNGQGWLDDEPEQGIQTRYPFLDRRLVEFCFAIPFEQFARPNEMRSLHRRALRGILPEQIRRRGCKRGPNEAIMRGFRREWPVIETLFADPEARVYQRGYVRRDRFLEELQKIRHGLYGDLAILTRVLQVEVWLRAMESPAAQDARRKIRCYSSYRYSTP
ncbi:MAG: asparagine synthase-related protein [Alphaproteobacteria bacterium]|nr:asparagine synthase-related protein [Alphaproteobacteria bacterium]